MTIGVLFGCAVVVGAGLRVGWLAVAVILEVLDAFQRGFKRGYARSSKGEH